MATANDKAVSEPMELVLALGHEIGNLLAATRLHTHLINADTGATELSRISATIGELASRMGSLLAQVRPLVSPVQEGPPSIDPVEVLDGVHRGIEESCDERVAVDLDSAAGLPMAVIDPEPLHHILLTLIYQALEESEPAGNDESRFEDIAGGALKGRALLYTVADAILRPRGGQIAARSLSAGNRVELTVPAARH
jgi:nitrogen-specific signal transduction histidine kinase